MTQNPGSEDPTTMSPEFLKAFEALEMLTAAVHELGISSPPLWSAVETVGAILRQERKGEHRRVKVNRATGAPAAGEQ